MVLLLPSKTTQRTALCRKLSGWVIITTTTQNFFFPILPLAGTIVTLCQETLRKTMASRVNKEIQNPSVLYDSIIVAFFLLSFLF